MRTPLTALTLLLTATAAWCNSPPPARIDKVVILEFPDDAVKWSVETNYGGLTRPVTLGPDRTFNIPVASGIITFDPYKHTARLYATDRDGRKRKSEPIDIHWDRQDSGYGQKEVRYRVELTPTDVQVHKISERILTSSNEMVVWALVASAVIALAGWRASVWWRRRKLTRTVPPPG